MYIHNKPKEIEQVRKHVIINEVKWYHSYTSYLYSIIYLKKKKNVIARTM